MKEEFIYRINSFIFNNTEVFHVWLVTNFSPNISLYGLLF
jgi:hypothetical protein